VPAIFFIVGDEAIWRKSPHKLNPRDKRTNALGDYKNTTEKGMIDKNQGLSREGPHISISSNIGRTTTHHPNNTANRKMRERIDPRKQRGIVSA